MKAAVISKYQNKKERLKQRRLLQKQRAANIKAAKTEGEKTKAAKTKATRPKSAYSALCSIKLYVGLNRCFLTHVSLYSVS